jgi:hypothetical protein
VSGVLIILGFILFMIGLVADIISFNRQLIEDILYRVKKMELNVLPKSESKEEIEITKEKVSHYKKKDSVSAVN